MNKLQLLKCLLGFHTWVMNYFKDMGLNEFCKYCEKERKSE